MKTFEEALKRAIDAAPFTPGLDDGGYNDGFIDGLEHAQQLIDKHKDDAIDEILEKHHEWVSNLFQVQLTTWCNEEEDKERARARIRREFIKYLNQKG